MSDIFVSYASADRDRARALAQALTDQGWSVWWDRTIPPGKQFDEVIEEALDSARCVVVLWSNASVASTWVKTEAAEAMRRKILVPVLIDEVKIPLEFRRLQAADLSQWKGERAHEELQKFFQSIEVNVGHGGASAVGPVPAPAEAAPHRAEVPPQPQAQPQPQSQPPLVARTEAPVPRSKTKAIGIGVAAFAAVVVIAVGYTAYNERVKRVAMEERAERERRTAEEARRVAEEAAARARAAQEEAAKEAARRKVEDQRRAAEDARRAAEAAARAKAAQEEAARARAAQEAAARAKTAQEEAARAARERADRLAEQERKQNTAARTTTMRVSFYDHALRYSGVLTGSGWTGTLRATVWDLRSGAQIGNYEVPMTVTRQGASDLVVSGNFSIPRDSVTPHPHVHTPRLILRRQSDGNLRFIENCPRAGECYPAK